MISSSSSSQHRHHKNGAASSFWEPWMQSLDSLMKREAEAEAEKKYILISSSDDTAYTTTSSDSSSSEEEQEQEDVIITSIDPGRNHCAVTRYNVTSDSFEAAALLDLMCCCCTSSESNSTVTTTTNPWSQAKKKKRKRKTKPPTVHDMARQTANLPDGLMSRQVTKLFHGMDLLVIERQMTDNTAMMIVAGVLEVVYGKMATQGSLLMSPQANKKFWNLAAKATGTVECFRHKAGHSKHKVDAKRMAKRILTHSEQSRFRRAAESNAAHRRQCEVHQTMAAQLKKKRIRKGQNPESRNQGLKHDDLLDACLQAIFAAQTQANIKPEDPEGSAYKRLYRTRRDYRKKS